MNAKHNMDKPFNELLTLHDIENYYLLNIRAGSYCFLLEGGIEYGKQI